ncbi:MAG: helix-hairpin-helix domain-containing protein [Rubricoccaceae bacterium]|nr:helix-hairpin-helix domain-containing protein [Rubricoccaceae bacterium]
MQPIYRLQQRLSITGTEAAAILVLTCTLALGLGIRELQGKAAEPVSDLFAEADSIWAARDSLAGQHDGQPSSETESEIVLSDSVAIPTSGYADAPSLGRRSSTNNPIRMNLNTANAATLQRLPGIGPALSGRIIAYRQDRGPFTRVSQVVNVRGIGDKTLEKIAEWLYVE